jgi:hypothetical protein
MHYAEKRARDRGGVHVAAGKVISMLLPALPARRRYKATFMDRPVEEVPAW